MSSKHEPLSILLTIDYLPPSGGGVETVVKNLAETLADDGHRVTVFALSEGKHERTSIRDDVEVVTASTVDLTSTIGLQSRVSMTAPAKFRRIVRSKEPDIIHAHNRFFFLSLVSVLNRIIGSSDTPLVFTAHAGPIDRVGGLSGDVARVYEQIVGRKIFQSGDAVISVSDSVAEYVRNSGGRNVHVVPNGVDTTTFVPPPDPNDQSPTVLFVGRLVHNKGPDVFVESLPRIFDRVPDASAELVGSGEMRKPLKARCRELGIDDRVTFHGYVDSVEEIMRDASVFCLPSYGEGLPLTLLEAMASGLPTVTTDVGGIPDVVKDGQTGVFAPTGDSSAVGEAVVELLEDPSRRQRMGSAAREYVVENHSWDTRARDVLSVYDSLLEE